MYSIEHDVFEAADGVELPFLLHQPDRKTDAVALYLHGNGSSSVFYSPRKLHAFASALADKGIAFFAFNNRGAHYIHKLKKGKEDIRQGTAYELIADCVKDIDGALDYLTKRGYKSFYLIGSSTGANKAVLYNAKRPGNRIGKYVLLSAGDDTGLYYDMFGEDGFTKALNDSRKKTKEGKGTELTSQYLTGGLISFQSLLDTIDPDGGYNIFPYHERKNGLKLARKPLFGEWKKMTAPTLVIYGSEDEYCYGDVPGCVEILKNEAVAGHDAEFRIIPGADHGFHGFERELAREVAAWLIA